MRLAVPPKLTPRDFTMLETMLADYLGGDHLLVAAIRKNWNTHKLSLRTTCREML